MIWLEYLESKNHRRGGQVEPEVTESYTHSLTLTWTLGTLYECNELGVTSS